MDKLYYIQILKSTRVQRQKKYVKNVDIIIVGIFIHFLIVIINCIYEPINNVGRSIEVNILLK